MIFWKSTPTGRGWSPAGAVGAGVAAIAVVDHGPGMPPEVAARAFERFYRADAARSRADGGSGLGLSIVAAIVAEHRGRVDLDTGIGHGCRVMVSVPLTTTLARL